jgi:hypothetical protein
MTPMKTRLNRELARMRIGKACGWAALLLLAIPAAVHAGDFNYTTNSPDTNTVTITGYTGPNGAVAIPAIIGGKTVTAIGNYAFYFNSRPTSVTIPDSVTRIGTYAFQSCANLASATLGNGVTNVGDWAFADCAVLTSVTVGQNVARLGASAFAGCPMLTSVCFKGSPPTLGGSDVFSSGVIVYYMAGATGWDSLTLYGGRLVKLFPFTYTTSSGAATITGYVGLDGVAIIPSTIEGLPVIRIGDQAFNPFFAFGQTSCVITR